MSTNPSRFPGVNEAGGWSGVFKTIVTSQVGGWIIAVILIAVIFKGVIKDREILYRDLTAMREKAMPALTRIEETALRQEKLLQEITKKMGGNPNP